MFSTPMDCSEAAEVLGGNIPERFKEEFSDSCLADEEDFEAQESSFGTDLRAFVIHCMMAVEPVDESTGTTSLIMEEARQEIRSQYHYANLHGSRWRLDTRSL